MSTATESTTANADLIRELRADIESLAELRDKHLSHTAAVVRALVQKRIEASQAAIDKAMKADAISDDASPTTAITDAAPDLLEVVLRFRHAIAVVGTSAAARAALAYSHDVVDGLKKAGAVVNGKIVR